MATVTGTNGNDNLGGTGDSDTINPLVGKDAVDGLGGSDTLIVDYSAVSVDPYAGAAPANVPSIISSNGGSFSGAVRAVDGSNYVNFSNIEHLQVKLDFWHNTFIIDADALALGASISLDGGSGNDTLDADLSALASIDLQFSAGGTTASFGTIISFEVFRLNLTAGADDVTTGSGDDRLTGNGGDDVLVSGAGHDVLDGGAGTNILNAGDGDDEIVSSGVDTVNGGGASGYDRWTGDYASSTADLTFTRDTAAGTASLSNGTTLSDIESIASLTTGSGDDTFIFTPSGQIEAFLVAAGVGEDSLTFSGSAFSGTISADGSGAFAGSLGHGRFSGVEHLVFTSGSLADSVVVDAAPLLSGATLSLDGAGGIDSISLDLTDFASISFVVGAGGAVTTNVSITLANFETYQIHSGGGDDVIATAGGNDLLDGGAGADDMSGGGGSDVYLVDSAADTVTENAGAGTDEIRTSLASFSLAPLVNVENLTGTASAAQALTGNGRANRISSGAGNDILSGGGGADHLSSGTGNDVLDGGTGGDMMLGGADDDVYVVDDSSDVVLDHGSGFDRLTSSADFVLDLFSEVELLEAADGSASIDLTGSLIANAIYGNAGANILNGESGDDLLVGLAGDDTLIGGSNLDTMQGGDGDDTYFVDTHGDLAIENAGEGLDTVYASASYALREDYEVERLFADPASGWWPMTLTGNSLANEIRGNDGDNILKGGAGNDVLDGGNGADTASYAGDFGAVWVDLAAGQGRWNYAHGDTLANIENAIGTEYGDRLVGTAVENTLEGRGGNDTLDGGFGADFLDGGAGKDTADYAGEYGGVWIDLSTGAGRWNSAQWDTLFRIENVIGTDFTDWLTGNGDNNRLEGGKGDDRLVGNAGNDVLLGGMGADVLDGGANVDTADYSGNYGGVWINFLTGQGKWNYAEGDTLAGIEKVIGTSFADTFESNGVTNIFTGGAGNDTFVFRPGFSQDVITDFAGNGAAAGDTLRFRTGIFTGYDDMLAHASQQGADVLIQVDAANFLRLQNVQLADLHSSDFIFG